MAWPVVFSAHSRTDLQKIVEYISHDNLAAAERFGSLLITQAESLANTPELGPVLPQRPATRFFPVGSYLIIYRLDTKKAHRTDLTILAFGASVASWLLEMSRRN